MIDHGHRHGEPDPFLRFCVSAFLRFCMSAFLIFCVSAFSVSVVLRKLHFRILWESFVTSQGTLGALGVDFGSPELPQETPELDFGC